MLEKAMPSDFCDDDSPAYLIADWTPFPLGRITLVLDVSYDAFARRHGVGACRVRINLPDGTSVESAASIAIIDGRDPVAARPMVTLFAPGESGSLPAGANCQILQRRPKSA